MNILPKKRWHVRTKDNIARVRKDEAEAREEERKRQQKLELAESEARINFLRKKSGLSEVERGQVQQTDIAIRSNSQQHVDLFSDFQSHVKTTNKELEKEKKEEREKYEKQIGYLTYLGQDTNEALKLRSWYEIGPNRTKPNEHTKIEKDIKNKHTQDPLTLINALLPPEKTDLAKSKVFKRARSASPVKQDDGSSSKQLKVDIEKPKKEKHKKTKKSKNKKHKKDKNICKEKKDDTESLRREKLEKLRKERLIRETAERARQEALLAPKETPSQTKDKNAPVTPRIVQKYNSQFNPELAKQNML